jgi:hypothetical protein
MGKEKWAFRNAQKSAFRQLYSNVLRNGEAYLYITIAFLIPFFLGHVKGVPNQILVGSAVNALLALGAFYMKGKKIILLITVPAVAAFLSGIVFGPASAFLLYLIPFIWAGNWLYIRLIRLVNRERKLNLAFAVAAASAGKAVFLFSAALMLATLNIVPQMFLFAMGALQLVTALLGGGFAAAVCKIRTLYNNK